MDAAVHAGIANERVLLIDLENCPSQIQHLNDNLSHYTQVVICYAHTNAKIPLDWLMPLSTTIGNNRLKIFKMSSKGKNSADFGISFHAGVLMSQLPDNSEFFIMSDDTDLDHVVNLLKGQGRKAQRIGVRGDEKATCQDNPRQVAEPEINSYCAHLVTYIKNRPAKKATLVNSIASKLQILPEAAESVLDGLVKAGALTINNEKPVYDDEKIRFLASAK